MKRKRGTCQSHRPRAKRSASILMLQGNIHATRAALALPTDLLGWTTRKLRVDGIVRSNRKARRTAEVKRGQTHGLAHLRRRGPSMADLMGGGR